MLRLCNLPKTGHWMGTAATTPTEGFILCVRTNVRWTGQPTTVSSHEYAGARRLVRRATRALRHPAGASASRSPVTNTFRCPLPSRCHDPRRTASYCVACCPAGALGRRATDRDEQGHFALFFERNGSAPSKDRTCDLGFRKTSGSEPGFDTGQRNRSGFSLLVQRDHLFSSPVAPPLPSSTIAARRSFAVMSA